MEQIAEDLSNTDLHEYSDRIHHYGSLDRTSKRKLSIPYENVQMEYPGSLSRHKNYYSNLQLVEVIPSKTWFPQRKDSLDPQIHNKVILSTPNVYSLDYLLGEE